MADWYYIGHYGQLGPLTIEQMDELIQGGVISHDTYIWCTGMPDWLHAGSVPDLKNSFSTGAPFSAPPPPPMPSVPPPLTSNPKSAISSLPYGTGASAYAYPTPYASHLPAIKSDRSRILAGILQIIFPFGVGRIYLGYAAYGVLQFVLVFCIGIGALWSIVDGILILAGTPKLDGYGRVLGE